MFPARRKVSPRQVAANHSNAQKSTGPKTPDGKARVSLNALKTGVYARTDHSLRQVMLGKGQDPQQYDQLHEQLVEAWRPEDVMQAMLVKSIADKTWDKLQLRGGWLESELDAMQMAAVQRERRKLQARRRLPGLPAAGGGGLWQARDSAPKFTEIAEILDCLENWFENETCPDEYPDAMQALYGECPTVAGHNIRELFMQLFNDDEAARQKAREELPNWIAQEKRDAQQDRELCRREGELRRKAGLSLNEEAVAAREAVLDRQIAEYARLLLQLKSNRALWLSRAQQSETAGEEMTARSGENSPEKGANGSEPVALGAVSTETPQKGQTKPSDVLESTT